MAKLNRQISFNTPARICSDVVSREVNGEEVILYLSTGTYFGLDPVGTRIWHLLQEGRSLRAIHTTMLEEYEVGEEQLTHDLLSLVRMLNKHRLIEHA